MIWIVTRRYKIYHEGNKPTASDVGLGNVDNVKQYSSTNPPPYPVTSVNGQTGAVKTVEVVVSSAAPDNMNDGDIWYKILT